VKPEFLRVKDVKERLGLCQRQAYQLLYEHKIPYYRFDGSLRVKESDLDAYIESHRVRRRAV
jgi:excisionase family DNA binding protein